MNQVSPEPQESSGNGSAKPAIIASLAFAALLAVYFQVLLSIELLNASAGADDVARANLQRQFAVLRAYFAAAAAIGWLGHLTIMVLWVRRRRVARSALLATAVLAVLCTIALFQTGVQGRIGGVLGAFLVPAAATLAILPLMARLLPVREA